MIFKQKKSFNLIELIVVIVILAILSVSAFAALTKWLAKWRDATRLSDLQVLSKSLDVAYSYLGYYPIPDNFVSINSWLKVFIRQWEVGNWVVSKLKELEKNVVDPTDKNPYTYSIDYKQESYQLMAMLENPVEDYYGYILNKGFAASDYQYRHPYIVWQNIWDMLTTWNIPIEKYSEENCIDLSEENKEYKLKFQEDIVLWTGKILMEEFLKREIIPNYPKTDCNGICWNLKIGNEGVRDTWTNMYSNDIQIDDNENIYYLWNIRSPNGLLWLLIMKLDKNKNIIWWKQFYTGTYYYYNISPYQLILSKDKKYLYVLAGFYSYDSFVIKMDVDWNIKWIKQLDDDYFSMAEDDEGNLYIWYRQLIKLDKDWNFLLWKYLKPNNSNASIFNIEFKNSILYVHSRYYWWSSTYLHFLNKELELLRPTIHVEDYFKVWKIIWNYWYLFWEVGWDDIPAIMNIDVYSNQITFLKGGDNNFNIYDIIEGKYCDIYLIWWENTTTSYENDTQWYIVKIDKKWNIDYQVSLWYNGYYSFDGFSNWVVDNKWNVYIAWNAHKSFSESDNWLVKIGINKPLASYIKNVNVNFVDITWSNVPSIKEVYSYFDNIYDYIGSVSNLSLNIENINLNFEPITY